MNLFISSHFATDQMWYDFAHMLHIYPKLKLFALPTNCNPLCLHQFRIPYICSNVTEAVRTNLLNYTHLRATPTAWLFSFPYPLFLNIGDWWWKNIFQQIDFPSPFSLNFFSIPNIISPIPNKRGEIESPFSVRRLPPSPWCCAARAAILQGNTICMP